MIDGAFCIAIWLNLICWGTQLQFGAAFIFLGIGIVRWLNEIK